MATTRELIEARAGGGVLAFNVITLEHAQGVIEGAAAAGRGVILQLSENAIRYHGDVEPIAAALRALAGAAPVPVALHLDHITEEALAARTADLGFSSVMFDASVSPYDENVARTRAVAARLHDAGVYVEAELGEIGGKGGAHAPGVRTAPGEAQSFVAETGVDALAVAVGSEHAMTTRDAALDVDLIARLAEAVPVPLVLHGSSGVPDDGLREAIRAGMAKINIGTALNIAFTGAVRERLRDESLTDPRRYLADARTAVATAVRAQLERLG